MKTNSEWRVANGQTTTMLEWLLATTAICHDGDLPRQTNRSDFATEG
jgi:hypothetical protein